MELPRDAFLLRIFLQEADENNGEPLFAKIVLQAREKKLSRRISAWIGMSSAFGFGADLPDKGWRHEIRQENCRDYHRSNERLYSVEGDVAGDTEEGQNRSQNGLKRQFQQFKGPGECCPNSQRDQFCANWNTMIPEQSVA
jgi:hypothetical protein